MTLLQLPYYGAASARDSILKMAIAGFTTHFGHGRQISDYK